MPILALLPISFNYEKPRLNFSVQVEPIAAANVHNYENSSRLTNRRCESSLTFAIQYLPIIRFIDFAQCKIIFKIVVFPPHTLKRLVHFGFSVHRTADLSIFNTLPTGSSLTAFNSCNLPFIPPVWNFVLCSKERAERWNFYWTGVVLLYFG